MFFRHTGESRYPGASGIVPDMWPLDSGFRRNDEGKNYGCGCVFSSCCRIASMTSGFTVS
jgi:hypothetical protein